MLFYIIQLFDINYKDDMLLAMTSVGIMRGTYVEGSNLDSLLDQEFPIFRGFFKTKEDKERACSLFFGMVDSETKLINLRQLLLDSGIEGNTDDIFQIMVIAGKTI